MNRHVDKYQSLKQKALQRRGFSSKMKIQKKKKTQKFAVQLQKKASTQLVDTFSVNYFETKCKNTFSNRIAQKFVFLQTENFLQLILAARTKAQKLQLRSILLVSQCVSKVSQFRLLPPSLPRPSPIPLVSSSPTLSRGGDASQRKAVLLVTREGYLGGRCSSRRTYVVWVSEWREERKTKVNEKWPLTSTKTKSTTFLLLQCFFYVYVLQYI